MRKSIFFLLSAAICVLGALAQTSGLSPGDFAPAYDPTHVAGPDKGTTTCPV